jgi:hypothetical protein
MHTSTTLCQVIDHCDAFGEYHAEPVMACRCSSSKSHRCETQHFLIGQTVTHALFNELLQEEQVGLLAEHGVYNHGPAQRCMVCSRHLWFVSHAPCRVRTAALV